MEEYFTVEEVAKQLKFEPQKIRRDIREGKLRALKFGKEYRISAGDIGEYLRHTETRPRQNGESVDRAWQIPA